MRTALDASPSALDEHERNFVANIREHGWSGTYVPADEVGPGFGYTTGLWLNFKFPELIMFLMKGEIAHATYWHIYRELKAGNTFTIREPIGSIFENLNAVLLEVPRTNLRSISVGAAGSTEEIISSACNCLARPAGEISLGF
jgi:hypothetical protein